jgi:vancomycin resistance protein YoaR
VAGESSFDVVSKVDRQEVDNALNQAAKELNQRFDFRGTDAAVRWVGELGIEIDQMGWWGVWVPAGTPDEVARASVVMKEARDTFDVAVKLAGQNAELVKRQTQVPERLTDAADYVTQCASEFAEATAKRALDEEAFDDALIVLRESLESLARQAGRAFTAPGDGVAWLLDAVRAK